MHVSNPAERGKLPETSTVEVTDDRSDSPSEHEYITLNDLLRSRAATIPDAPILGYPVTDRGCSDYIYYTTKDLDRLADGAASVLVRNGLSPNTLSESSASNEKVVAVLAPSNLDYVVTLFALIRMRCTVLLLSNRLAKEAYISLLEKTNCHHIIGAQTTQASIQAVQTEYPLHEFSIPTKVEYDGAASVTLFKTQQEDRTASLRTAFIIHSSGSTGLPKPIFQTHSACIANFPNGNGFRAFLTLPLFHNHGLSTFFRAYWTGTPIAFVNANLPLTASNLVEAMVSVQPESFHGVPYALKLLSESDQGTKLLSQCKLVMFGGSSCPDELGDKLVNAGVYLVSHYGATEMGQLMSSFRPAEDKAWNYVRPSDAVKPYLYFAPQGDDMYECVVLDGWRAKVASNSNDPPNSFHTSDLFIPHPAIPDAWKYLSRSDDRITLINGEKVLPIPFEHQVRQHELVREALLFGVGKPLPGLLVVPSSTSRHLSRAQFIKKIWPTIEIANSKAEAFGQISEEMVEVLDPTTDYPSTDKGTIIRAASYKRFAELIEAVYQRFEGDAGVDPSTKLTLTVAELEHFLLETLTARPKLKDIAIATDFFEAGVDSLQAIQIWSLLKRKINTGTAELGQNVLFEHPSIEALTKHLYALRTGETEEREDEIDVMSDLIAKYSHFDKHVPRAEEVVLLTGTTGSLGVHILAQLLPLPHVKCVYCLVRASSASNALDRVLSTLSEKALTPFQNVSKIVALPSNLSRPDLGLDGAVISTLRSSLTKVIHSAWAVNFNLGVRSFEQQHIQGVLHLLNLCLSVSAAQPAQFFFCSSISAAAGTPLPASIQEAHIEQLAHAQDMGYARSKLVTEHIIGAAAKSTGMVAKVLRVGQIVGDSVNGIWNTTEAIPLMIQSAVTMGALPALDETPSWLPVDLVAKATLELAGITEQIDSSENTLHDPSVVYHVQNPALFHWTKDFLPALRQAGLQFETVSQREWVQRLRNSDPDPTSNPTIKLVKFFADKYDNDKPGRKGLVFRTEKTEAASPSLKGGYDVIGGGLVDKMVKQFLRQW